MAGNVDQTADMRHLWPQILEEVKRRRRFAWILLYQNATVMSYDGSTLVLSVTSAGVRDNFTSSGSNTVLEAVLTDLLACLPAIEVVVGGETLPAKPVPVPVLSELPTPTSAEGAPVTAGRPSLSPDGGSGGDPEKLRQALAQTAFLVHEQGNSQAAALLLDVEHVQLEPGNRFGDWLDAVLIVPPYLVPRFSEDMIAVIQPVFEHVAGRYGIDIGGVSAAPALPEVGENWRQILQERLAQGAASNQAARTRSRGAAASLSRDGFVFDSREEMSVYEALKRTQAALPSDSIISIFPLPWGGSELVTHGPRTSSWP